MCIWEARQSGRPGDKYTVRCLEAGPCRRPYSIHLGSPTMREAHYQDLYLHGRRSVPEALLCVNGKPDRAGGPVINKWCWLFCRGRGPRCCHINLDLSRLFSTGLRGCWCSTCPGFSALSPSATELQLVRPCCHPARAVACLVGGDGRALARLNV